MARLAAAQTITDLPILSGFDAADQSTTNTDELEFSECTQASGTTCATTSDARVNIQRTRIHDGGNEDGTLGTGDLNTSKWAGVSTVATAAASGYYQLAQPINPRDTAIYAAASFNVDTAPASGTSRTILAMVETSQTDLGCAVALDANRQLTLFYASGNSGGSCTSDANCTASFCATSSCTCQGGSCWPKWGTTTQALRKNACVGDVQKPCLTGADCVSGTCSSTAFYWGGVELAEKLSSSSDVTCELYLDGVPMFTGVSQTITGTTPVQPVSNVAIGVVAGPGTSNGTATIYFDDLVLQDSGRPGFGYVARKVPKTSGSPTQWGANTGGGCTATTRIPCVNDYDTGPNYIYFNDPSNNAVQKTAVGKQETYAATTPDLVIPNEAVVTAIEAVVLGNTSSGSGQRTLQTKMLLGPSAQEVSTVACNGGTRAGLQCTTDDLNTTTGCPGATCPACCVPGAQIVLASGTFTAPHVWQRLSIDASPIGGTSLGQLVNQLGQAEVIGTGNTDIVRVGALLEYVRVRRPDVSGPRTLQDHNGDGLVTVMAVGDSTLTGTLQVHCTGGTNDGALCSQDSYCDWDTFHSQPTGGCHLNNAICQTCALHRDAANAGAGFPCGVTADCVLTCDTVNHVCQSSDGPTTVPCTSNPDCDFGTCATTAACVESCPGGSCPTGMVGWAATLPDVLGNNADVIVSCGQNGEQISEMYVNRFTALLAGTNANCSALSGTGACTCSVATDCAASGGVCDGTTHLCTAGDTTKTNCVAAATCGAGFLCQFPAPDYIVTNQGYNELNPCSLTGGCTMTFAGNASNCDNGLAWRGERIGCPTKGTGQFQVASVPACTVDGDATSGLGTPYAQCGGWCLTGTDTGCLKSADCGSGGICSTGMSLCAANPVTSSIHCPGSLTCSGTSALVPTAASGTCHCGSNTQCTNNYGAGYACVGDAGLGVCRRSCPNGNIDCATARGSACVTFAGAIGNGEKVCQGRATLPCDAIPCATDPDCAPNPPGYFSTVGRYGASAGPGTGGLVDIKWTGTCNRARGRCANCGPTVCGGNQLQAPCSCTTNAECGASGTCTNNLCTGASDAAKLDCHSAGDCAPLRQCMRPDAQFNAQHAYHHLPAQVAHLMQQQVDRMPSGKPTLLFLAPPQLNGLAATNTFLSFFPDAQCDFRWTNLGPFYDRDFIAQVRDDLAAAPWLPARHFIDLTPSWDAGKNFTAYHNDEVHYSTVGANLLSAGVGAALQNLGVCTAGGVPQKYCYSPAGVFSTACTTNAGCTGGGLCVRRPCTTAADCPDAGDVCTPD